MRRFFAPAIIVQIKTYKAVCLFKQKTAPIYQIYFSTIRRHCQGKITKSAVKNTISCVSPFLYQSILKKAMMRDIRLQIERYFFEKYGKTTITILFWRMYYEKNHYQPTCLVHHSWVRSVTKWMQQREKRNRILSEF